jgi:DNA topoisomerase IB
VENGKCHVFPLLVTRGGGHAAIASGRLLRTGIRRVRRGRGFSHVDENDRRNHRRRDARAHSRARVPPDVWICPHPNGHIQALGTDARGRRQYCYHDAWRRQRRAARLQERLPVAPRPLVGPQRAREGADRRRLVCRASYVDPRVFDRFDAGITIADALKRLVDDELGDPVGQARIARAVLDLISDEEPPPD